MAETVDQAEGTDQVATPSWLIWAQAITAVLTFIGTFWLSLAGKAAAPFAVAGVGLLLLFRFGDIASLTLEGLGGRAELRRATRKASRVTQEAEKTILALKETGMHLSSMVMLLQTLVGQGGSITIAGVLNDRHTIINDLKALGCSDEEITSVLEYPDHATVIQLVGQARNSIRADYGSRMSPELNEVMSNKPVDMAAVRAVFAKYEMSDRAERYLTEAEKFQKTGELDLKNLEPY